MIYYAQKNGLEVYFGPHGGLDFAKTFSWGEYDHKYYSGRRIWRALSLLAPERMKTHSPHYENVFAANYPWSVKPEIEITE